MHESDDEDYYDADSDDYCDTDFMDADEILAELAAAGLVGYLGTVTVEPEADGADRCAGMATTTSSFVDDEVLSYELHIARWIHPVREEFTRDVVLDALDADFVDWDRLLFVVAGNGWSVAALVGDPDALIPPGLADQVIARLGGAVVMSRETPVPRAATSRFVSVEHLIAELRRSGVAVDEVTGDDLAEILEQKPRLAELQYEGAYGALRMRRHESEPGSTLVQLVLSPHSARAMVNASAAMLGLGDRDGEQWAICAGEGWSVTISGGERPTFPPVLWAAEFMGALSGEVVGWSPGHEPAMHHSIIIDAFASISRLSRLPRDTVAALDDSYDRHEHADPHDLLQRSARLGSELSIVARESGQHWHEAYLRRRGITPTDAAHSQRINEVTGASRRLCWAALSLSLLAALELPGVEPQPADIALRERMLADVRSCEAIVGPMTRSRRFRRATRAAEVEFFAEVRSAGEVAELLNHGHAIPVTRVLTRAYMIKNFPGWTWNSITTVLRAMDVVEKVGAGTGIGRCRPDVDMVYFTDATHWAVDWADGTTTRSAT